MHETQDTRMNTELYVGTARRDHKKGGACVEKDMLKRFCDVVLTCICTSVSRHDIGFARVRKGGACVERDGRRRCSGVGLYSVSNWHNMYVCVCVYEYTAISIYVCV